MEAIGVQAAGAALLGQSVFDYNRENFHYDRELRLHKEFKELHFRVIQADLWRQDIRDIIGLVELKTKKYLLVNVLMLGFTISLWVQGILPETTPAWLMLGNQVAIGGSFCFILLTVWLAMHASISAQGFQTRLLTQLVRLPIPTWEELESARTYGSQFEKVEARQMFRIPFAMGKQENLVPEAPAPPKVPSSGDASALPGPFFPSVAEVPTDPWGLESRGDSDRSNELGCPYNQECAELRHIRLVRQAAQFWQSYDAFARISMTIGVNQLMLAMSYYILAYVLVQARAPCAAFAGVVSLIGLAQVLAALDMALPRAEQTMITLLIISGPFFACVACYHWGYQFGAFGSVIYKALAPAAFISHGLLVLVLCYSCHPKGQGFLPTAFGRVLYLDVFGWTSRFSKDEESAEPPLPPALPVQELLAPSVVAEVVRKHAETGPNEIDPKLASILEGWHDSDEEAEGEVANVAGMARKQVDTPALKTITYDPTTGHAFPVGIKDLAPPGIQRDLRALPGAPHEGDVVSYTDHPKQFFDSTSFYPRTGTSTERKLERMLEAADPIVSGHDHEQPGRVPYRVFMFATVLLGSVWIVAAIYQLLDSMHYMNYFTKFRIETIEEQHGSHSNYSIGGEPSAEANNVASVSFLQSWTVSQPSVEQLDVSLPFSHMLPQGLSCDSTGRFFALTDGLSTFVGEATPRRKLRGQGGVRSSRFNHSLSVGFREVARCESLLGEALQDTAIACGGNGKDNLAACEVLLLHHHAERVASCPVVRDATSASHGKVAALSQRWLKNKREKEKAVSLLLDGDCVRHSKTTSRMGCASVGTTHGRVAHLQHSESLESATALGALFPDNVMPDVSRRKDSALAPGMVRAFNGRYLGVLQRDRSGIQVLDTYNDLAEVGTLSLPIPAKAHAFCSGGNHVYILSQGAAPQMWRLPLPRQLAA